MDLDRSRIALYAALGLVVCVLGVRYLHGQPAAAPADAGPGDGAAASRAAGQPDAPAGDGSAALRVDRVDGGRVTVHVAGAVHRPGLYHLPAGSRIADALRRAGGARHRADLTAINLAMKLEDGRQVLVPERPAGGAGAAAGAPAGSAAPGAPGTPGTPGAPPAVPVNLNTATVEQLDTLDGVGPGIAQRIIAYREQHGGFRNVDELGEVPGIGDKRLAALRPAVTV